MASPSVGTDLDRRKAASRARTVLVPIRYRSGAEELRGRWNELPSPQVGVEFRILGPLEVATENGPVRLGGRKQRGVLAILLLHANEVVSVERLADELYAGSPPATAGAQVRDHVSQLRKLLGPEAGALLETRSPGYVLHLDAEQLDAARFERLLTAASDDLAGGQDARATARLREALA